MKSLIYSIKSIVIPLLGLSFLVTGPSQASPATYDIPGDFPGNFQINFLGTDFTVNGLHAGSLSTASTIDFSVGSETFTGSGIYNTSVAPGGFKFLGFQPGWFPFDVHGAGTGTGTFNTNTGDWVLDMPTLFVDFLPFSSVAEGTRMDLHLTTHNISIPGANPGPFGFPASPGYTTTTASPMVIDAASSDPWGSLNLVAGGLVPNASALTLTYDWGLINTIANGYVDNGYTSWMIDQNQWEGMQYEFDIYGNNPTVSSVPVPAAVWLFGSGLLGLIGVARRKAS